MPLCRARATTWQESSLTSAQHPAVSVEASQPNSSRMFHPHLLHQASMVAQLHPPAGRPTALLSVSSLCPPPQRPIISTPYPEAGTTTSLVHMLPQTNSFPVILYDAVSNKKYDHIVSWSPDGRGFIIHDRDAFSGVILPLYFDNGKFESFTRRLKRWGFVRVQDGYHHENFQRGKPHLLCGIRYTGDGNGGRETKKCEEERNLLDRSDGGASAPSREGTDEWASAETAAASRRPPQNGAGKCPEGRDEANPQGAPRGGQAKKSAGSDKPAPRRLMTKSRATLPSHLPPKKRRFEWPKNSLPVEKNPRIQAPVVSTVGGVAQGVGRTAQDLRLPTADDYQGHSSLMWSTPILALPPTMASSNIDIGGQQLLPFPSQGGGRTAQYLRLHTADDYQDHSSSMRGTRILAHPPTIPSSNTDIGGRQLLPFPSFAVWPRQQAVASPGGISTFPRVPPSDEELTNYLMITREPISSSSAIGQAAAVTVNHMLRNQVLSAPDSGQSQILQIFHERLQAQNEASSRQITTRASTSSSYSTLTALEALRHDGNRHSRQGFVPNAQYPPSRHRSSMPDMRDITSSAPLSVAHWAAIAGRLR